MTDEVARAVIKRHEKMKSMRTNWDSHWQEITDYIVPRKNDVWARNRTTGDKRNNTLFDGTAIISNQLLSSALAGMLINPANIWFSLRTGIREIDREGRVRDWLQRAAARMVEVMNQSNFQDQMHEAFIDLGSMGTAIVRIEEDDDMIIRFKSRPIYEHYLDENYKGLVDSVSRELRLTSRQIDQQFGFDKLSKKFKSDVINQKIERMKQDPDREWEIIHMVSPRKDFEKISTKGTRFKFKSVQVLQELEMTLEEKGFEEFPYAVSRWTKVSGEKYGRGPGMQALPDIKMINEMMKTHIRAAQKIIDPPLQMPDDGALLPLRTTPGGINYYRAGSKDRIEPLFTGGRLDISFQIMEDVRNRIREVFFVNQLQLSEGPQMTATEVLQRTEEKLRLMGPVLGRQNFELLKPIVNRVFGILLRKNELPEDIPPELLGRELDVQFSSSIARAQRASETDNLQRVISIVAPIAQVDPTVMDNVDADKYIKFVSDALDVPQEIFRDEEEVEELRKQRQAAQQQAVAQQQQLTQAETLNKAGIKVQDL